MISQCYENIMILVDNIVKHSKIINVNEKVYKKNKHPQIQVPTQMQFVILFVGKLTKVMPPFPPPRK